MITSLALMLTLAAVPEADKGVFGLAQDAIEDALFSNVTTQGLPWVPVSKELKAMAPAARVAAVPVLVKLAKTYLASDAFKKRYAEWRTSLMPEKPKPVRPMAQIQAGLRKRRAEVRQEQDEMLKKLPKEVQVEMKKTLDAASLKEEAMINDTKTQGELEKMRFDVESQEYDAALKAHPERAGRFHQSCADSRPRGNARR